MILKELIALSLQKEPPIEEAEEVGDELDEAKITAAQVKAAEARADRAELAVEREQKRSGYSRSNDKVRELKVKAQKLRSEAFSLRREFERANKANKKLDEASTLTEAQDLDDLIDKWIDANKAHNWEGRSGIRNLTKLVGVFGYSSLESFLEDNMTVVDAIIDAIRSAKVVEWEEDLRAAVGDDDK